MRRILALATILLLLPFSNVCAEPCAADISCDGQVNLADLVAMKSEFLNTGCDPCMCNPAYNCPAAMVDCGGTCIDPMTDREHCGAMPGCVGGSVCAVGEICDAGVCTLSCQPGLIECGGMCVDMETNENHCGGCNNPCESGEICVAGNCQIYCTDNYAPIPQTGQTECYYYTDHEWGVIPCDGTGQDGEYQKGVEWPEPRFVDHEDGTVTDRLTTLMWTKDISLIQGVKQWDAAISACNNLDFANYTDWRVPNVRELLSLIDFSVAGFALPNGHPFVNNNGSAAFYWSSTTGVDYWIPLNAWKVRFSYENDTYLMQEHKTAGMHNVWCVRGGH